LSPGRPAIIIGTVQETGYQTNPASPLETAATVHVLMGATILQIVRILREVVDWRAVRRSLEIFA
jgi:hypothetical protein